MSKNSWAYRVLTFNGRDPSGLLPFARRSWLYYSGIAFIAGKLLATVLQFSHLSPALDTVYGDAFRAFWYDVGKATPTLFCLAFLLDAALYRKDQRAVVFWSWALVIALAITILVLELVAHGFSWNGLDIFKLHHS